MKVGTVETIPEPEKKPRPRRSGFSGGNAPSGGNGGNGGDNNSPRPDANDRDGQEIERFEPNKSRILMWFLLVVVTMTFGGLIGAYIVISTNANGMPEWQPFNLPFQIWVSTALILASSVTYHFAKSAIFRDRQQTAKQWLIATTALGGTFISSQILAWFLLNARGVYMQSNPYAGFFYILTAVHAVHVIGGIIALGSVVLRTWFPTDSEELLTKRRTYAQVVGWYWHFMGVLWLVLVGLLGFWK